jgi:hypothetical protein
VSDTDPTLNLAGSWKRRRKGMRGFGKGQFGTTPFGARAEAFGLARIPWTAGTTPNNLAGSWTAAETPDNLAGDWE